MVNWHSESLCREKAGKFALSRHHVKFSLTQLWIFHRAVSRMTEEEVRAEITRHQECDEHRAAGLMWVIWSAKTQGLTELEMLDLVIPLLVSAPEPQVHSAPRLVKAA